MRDVIVLVPGFAASELKRFKNQWVRPEKLWLSTIDVIWNGILELDLETDIANEKEYLVLPSGILEAYYQPFMEWFRRGGYEVLTFPYDWRRDIRTNGAKLLERLNKLVTEDAEITVVGHSMGGLVAACALQNLDPQHAQKVPRFVTCGTPWQGSFRAVELLTGEHDTFKRILSYNAIFSAKTKYHWREDMKRVVATWEGVYDMLPSPDLLALYETAPEADPWTGNAIRNSNVFIHRASLDAALLRRPTGTALPAGIQHTNYLGIDRETAGPMPSVSDGSYDFYFRSLLGDGTVPESSARPPRAFNSNTVTMDAEHEQFCNEPAFLASLTRLLNRS